MKTKITISQWIEKMLSPDTSDIELMKWWTLFDLKRLQKTPSHMASLPKITNRMVNMVNNRNSGFGKMKRLLKLCKLSVTKVSFNKLYELVDD